MTCEGLKIVRSVFFRVEVSEKMQETLCIPVKKPCILGRVPYRLFGEQLEKNCFKSAEGPCNDPNCSVL